MNKAQIISCLSSEDKFNIVFYRSMIYEYLCKYQKKLAKKYKDRRINESHLELLKDLKRIKRNK